MKNTIQKGTTAMPKVKVYVRNDQKDVKVPTGIRLLIRKCCQAVLKSEGFDKAYMIKALQSGRFNFFIPFATFSFFLTSMPH